MFCGSWVWSASELSTVKTEIEAAVSDKIRAVISSLSNRSWPHQAPPRAAYPYAVVAPISQTPLQSSKGMIAIDDLIAVMIYAQTAAQANSIANDVCDKLNRVDVELSGSSITKLYCKQIQYVKPETGANSQDTHERVVMFQAIRTKRG